MARTQSINDAELIDRLSLVFRREGYAGASLTALAEAAGLKKASLYHRFPRGKEQMAEEVLAAAVGWYREHVLEPLAGNAPVREKLAAVAAKLRQFYDGGHRSCLLNMLASSQQDENPFATGVREAFAAIVAAFASAALQAGLSAAEARQRAERVVALLHGNLVMARGMGSARPFEVFLANLADDLLGDAPQSKMERVQ